MGGTTVASPGRIEDEPFRRRSDRCHVQQHAGGASGHRDRVPLVVATEPVTCNFCETGDTNGPAKPTFTGSRVSKTRTGSIVTTDDGALGPTRQR